MEYGHTDPNLDPGGYRSRSCQCNWQKNITILRLVQELEGNFHSTNIVNNGKAIEEKLRAGQLDYFFMYESSSKVDTPM